MKAKQALVYGLLMVILALTFTACKQPTDPPAPSLTDITLNTALVKKAYTQNERLNLSGLVVTASYSNGSSVAVTSYTSNPTKNSLLSTTGTITITISYTEETVIKSAAYDVTVTAPTPTDITYTAVQFGGVDGETDSASITFTFSKSIDSLGLTAADISVDGSAGKDPTAALTGTGTSRTLVITVSSAGTATVKITKTGIEAGTKHVTVYKANQSAPTLNRITAAYSGTAAIYTTTPIDNLKANLTVKALYSNGSENTLSENEYILSGTLSVGTSTVTASYEGKTTSFSVTVIDIPITIFTVTSGNTLTEKLQWVKANAQSNTIYTLEVSASECIEPQTLSYEDKINITIKLIGSDSEKVVSLLYDGSLFTIETGVTLILDNNITLQGQSNNSVSLVRVNSGGALIMDTGSKVFGNKATSSGGGVYCSGTFTMNGGEISGNITTDSGSGVYVDGGIFTMENGEITGNTASRFGGGVYVDNGTFTIESGEIFGNAASNSGGGVYVDSGSFIMNNGNISNNTVPVFPFFGGGGVYVSGSEGRFTMNNGEISGNTGSGVYLNGGVFNMNDGKILSNTVSVSSALSSSGGVYVSSGVFTMYNGTISNNVVSVSVAYSSSTGRPYISPFSGGVYVGGDNDRGIFSMYNGTISNNTVSFTDTSSGSSAGGVYVGRRGNYQVNFTIHNGIINNNTVSVNGEYTSSSVGGVYLSGGTFTMNGGEISSNTGSGVHINDGILTMTNGKITDHTISRSGGGVYLNKGIFTMSGGGIYGNTTSGSGGGVFSSGTFTMSGGEIFGNTASIYGGGVFSSGTFIMSGGEIFGNTANFSGGGVSVGGTFTKTGGTITGYVSDQVNGNVVKDSSGNIVSDSGHAVYAGNKRKETTAGPGVNLSSGNGTFSGGWDF